jgi:tRNA-dihydrouridine synthase B
LLPQPLKIGPLVVDPPLLQAPMAGFTGHGYRQMLRRLGGVGLLATEMVSARAVLEMESRGSGLPERLWRVAEEGRPLAVQIWDNDPGLLAQVGRRLAQRVRPSAVDINFGCPIRNVSEKAQSGSYLLRYPDRVGEIVGRVVEACAPTPVTAKIRLGWTRETINAVEVAQAVEAAGGAAVTVHGRTAAQRFRGSADWEQIAAIKPHLRRIPLIGNGDLSTTESVVEAFRRWGVDGVMIGRAGLSKPWLFRQAAAALGGSAIPPDPTPVEQRELLLEHYRLVVEQFGRTKGTILMRRCACRYARGTAGAKEFRAEVCRVSTPEEFVEVVGRFFAADAGAC